jgi:glyoxylate reductase
LGKIGQAVARRASAFDMEVIFVQRRPGDQHGFPRVALDDLLARSDVVSLHTPGTPETRHLINERALARMKPGAILINTARGPVVDEAALVAALASGHLGGAGLDVTEHEPAVHPALLAMDNVVVTPHLGGGTVESRREARACAIANVAAVLRGEAPLTPIPYE